MKPFDLEAAKNGAEVYTRDGRKAKIVCFDTKFTDGESIIAVILNDDEVAYEAHVLFDDGRVCKDTESRDDLMMVDEHVERWVNVYRDERTQSYYTGDMFRGEHQAKRMRYAAVDGVKDTYITTIKVEWEE